MTHVQRVPFGRLPDGTQTEKLTLRRGGLSCDILTYGGAVQRLTVPAASGGDADVVLGLETLEDYCAQDKYLGALVGRYANRIGGAAFSLNGTRYALSENEGGNHLHGGLRGFDKQVWAVEEAGENFVVLALFSPHGQEGYPGDLSVRVTYTLTHTALEIEYWAVSSLDTICSLTNHTYFNLAGHDSGPVTNQWIQIFGQAYTPVGPGSIPSGEIAAVEGTPMDLRVPRRIGAEIDAPFPQLALAGGYDHNWVVDGPAGTLRRAARAWSEETGITLEVLTTMPGMQFYTGNFLAPCPAGKGGVQYGNRWGFCLETQHFPNAPNCPAFPSPRLGQGEIYRQKTVYRFGHLV